MKKLTFLALAICFAMNTFAQVQVATVSGPLCTHTLVMNDQYDDTWNGASVDILVNGTVVASTSGPAYGVADDTLAFDAASGDSISLGNWVSGSYDSEISWAILDGEGSSLGSGGFGDGTAGLTAYCTPPPPCAHTLVMNDQYDDTWNGASVDILVNGTVVASTSGPAYGVADDTKAFDAASGDSISLGNWVSGSYDSEISWAILDGAGTEIAAGVYEGGTDAVSGNCPSCFTPTDLTVSGVTTTSATLNWVSDGSQFMIEIQGSGVPQGTQGAGGYVIGDVTPYPLTSVTLLDPDTGAGVLTPNTSYDFWVVNVCAGANSEYAGPFTFTTECDAVTAFPYAQGFEDLECWTNDNPSAAWQIGNGVGTANPGSVTEGSSAVFFNSYGYQSTTGLSTLMSPSIDLSALTVPNLTFDFVDVGTSPGSDVVEVVVENGSGAVVVSTLDQPQEWTSVIIDLSAYANETIQIGFRVTSDWGYSNPHIDNLTVAEAPACITPTNLSVSGVTTTSATLNWDSEGNAFMIEIQGSGVPQGTQGAGGYVIGDVDPYPLTSVTLLDPDTGAGVLTSNTSYDFWVVNVCADGNSEYAGPFTFTTPCDTVTVFPYAQGFEDLECWTNDNPSAAWQIGNGVGTANPGFSYRRFIGSILQ